MTVLPFQRHDTAAFEQQQNMTNPHDNEGFFDPEILYHKDVAHIDGAEVKYRVYEPTSPSEDTPIHIRNGFMASGPVYYALAEEMARLGRWTVVTESVRHQHGLNVLHPNRLRLQAQAGYAAMRDVGYWLDTPQADIMGHSMGGVVATMIANRHPERVRAINYTGAAGQDGGHAFANRVNRIPRVISHEITPNIAALREHSSDTAQLAIESFKYIFPHMLRTLGEGIQVARTDDRLAITNLRKGGIAVGAVLMEDDGFFDVEAMMKASEGIFDIVTVIPGALHIDPNINPTSHAEIQVDMFEELNYHERRNHLQLVP